MNSPSAAHPMEGIGREGYSVASARREISKCIKEAYDDVNDGKAGDGLVALNRAENLAIELKDALAERAVVRAMASCYRDLAAGAKSKTDKDGFLNSAIQRLERGLELSMMMGEYQGDADMYGDIGDLYVEMGDLTNAGLMYDKCIQALSEDKITFPSSSWDC